MPPTERPWFRAYSEMPRDRKLRREKPETRWLWVTLMCMAGASPKRGSLFVGASPATFDDIADEAALPLPKVRSGMTALEGAGMIERNGDGAWHLRNWDARQFESDRSTDRVRAFRQRQGNVPSAVSVTPPDTEADTDLHHQPVGEPPDPQPVDDDDERRVEQPDPAALKLQAVFERCADAKMRTVTPQNPAAYRAKVIGELAHTEGARLRKLIVDHDTAPVDVLAGALLGEPNHLADYRTKTTA